MGFIFWTYGRNERSIVPESTERFGMVRNDAKWFKKIPAERAGVVSCWERHSERSLLIRSRNTDKECLIKSNLVRMF